MPKRSSAEPVGLGMTGAMWRLQLVGAGDWDGAFGVGDAVDNRLTHQAADAALDFAST